MSNNVKSKITGFFKFIWEETRKGNMLPLIAIVVIWLYVVAPVYDRFTTVIDGNSEATAVVAMDVYAMEEKIKELEAKVNEDFSKRRAGHVGITSH